MRSLLTSSGRGRRITSGLLALALIVSGTLWWLWPEGTSTTTDAPPPTPLAATPPTRPTDQLWRVTTRDEVMLAPGGYVVLAGENVVVRDLFTGELRWEFQHPERALARVVTLGTDQMVVRFGQKTGSDLLRAFHIPSGRRLDVAETSAAIKTTEPAKPPKLTDRCGRELDHAFIPDLDTWLLLVNCGKHTDVVSVSVTGQIDWQTKLPVAAADFAAVTVADTGFGVAAVYATDQNPERAVDQMFGVDLATGEASAPVPVGKHFLWSPRPEDIIAVPEGICAWEGELDLSIACYDLATGQQRWHRRRDPVNAGGAPVALVLPDDTLLLMTDEHPSRWVGYRLADGEPQFDLDRLAPVDPQVAHYGDGVMALTGRNGMYDSLIVVYGDAQAPVR